MKTEAHLKHLVEETKMHAKQLVSAIDDKATFLAAVRRLVEKAIDFFEYYAAGAVVLSFDALEHYLYPTPSEPKPKPPKPSKKEEVNANADISYEFWREPMRRREIRKLRRINRQILKEAGGKTPEYHANEDLIARLKEDSKRFQQQFFYA